MSTPAPGVARPPAIQDLVTDFQPKFVVLDIDGTLIDDDLNLHPRNRAAVRAAARRVPVLLATGRMYRSALPWATELTVTAPLVCYQGALVQEQPPPVGTGEVLFEEGLDVAIAQEGIRIAHANGWHVQAYVDDVLYCDEDRPEGDLYSRIAQVPITYVDDLVTLVTNGTTKIVIVSEDPAVTDAAVSTYRSTFGGNARVTRSLEQFVEMVSPQINKAKALTMLCGRLGLRLGDAVAVGDAGNDAEMLAGAGIGVVWRDARPEVLAVADAVCGGPGEAGVATVLERFGLSSPD